MKKLLVLLSFIMASIATDCADGFGGTLADGDEMNVYSVSHACNCYNVVDTIWCTAGVLYGAKSYAYKTCTKDDCSCTDPIVGNVPYEQTVFIYSAPSACSCSEEVRTTVGCDDSGLLAAPAEFVYASCNSTCCDHLGSKMADGTQATVYSSESPCNTCSGVTGTVYCDYGVLTGDTSFGYTTCSPTQCSNTGGDPHFYGFLGQKVYIISITHANLLQYDVMGQSFEIYNILTSPNLQINSRFTPYFKTASQVVPTGTMIGELGIKFGKHYFQLNSNETEATLDKTSVDMSSAWLQIIDGTTVENEVKHGNMYSITIKNSDVAITFKRRTYIVAGLEKQWHFDYSATLLSSGENLHGLLGQSWENKFFADKDGAFKYLDGEEDNYRIQSNNMFGDDFTYNRFVAN